MRGFRALAAGLRPERRGKTSHMRRCPVSWATMCVECREAACVVSSYAVSSCGWVLCICVLGTMHMCIQAALHARLELCPDLCP